MVVNHSSEKTANLPRIPLKIGVFDSGLGGLTVLQTLLQNSPQNHYIYLGDTARVPYGSKSPATIRKYSEECMNFLIDHKVDFIVIACNSASSVFDESHYKNLPLLEVIQPSAELAVKLALNERVAVIATRATINNKAYVKAIHKRNPLVSVYPQACPLLVPFVEEGLIDDPLTNLILYRYLNPILQVNPDVLVLGCTHYPLLLKAIRKVVGNQIPIVSSAEALLEDFVSMQNMIVKNNINNMGDSNSAPAKGSVKIFLTDTSSSFDIIYGQLFPKESGHFEKVFIGSN